jgi:type VI secretion system protein ImpH
VVGNEVWDHHGRIRISIGPMSFERYVSFMPGHAAHKALADWVRFFSSEQYEAEVQLILNRDEAPPCQLGLRGEYEPRLGLATWLKTKPLKYDPGDALFLLT